MDDTLEKRHNMIINQIKARRIDDESVIKAMLKVPRHKFLPENLQNYAYEDSALGVSSGQTISQPYIVALMTSMIKGDKRKSVLEIGTGTGYQTAILAEIFKEVVTIERIEELYKSAKERLKDMGYNNVECILGDGYEGYPKKGPYDAIIVTAYSPEIPQTLVDQLAIGGKMAIPVGIDSQYLLLVTKDSKGEIKVERNIQVRFVPMIHERSID